MESGRQPCRGSPTGWTCGSSSSSMWRSSYLSTCYPDGPDTEPRGSGITGCTLRTQAGPFGGAFAQHRQQWRMRVPIHGKTRGLRAGGTGACCTSVHPRMYYEYCL